MSVTARLYDALPARYYQPAYRFIAGSLEITSGAVLDVGCGPGWVSIHTSANNAELDCVGIDTNPEMVGFAERNAGGRLNCTFKVMDAAEIVYPDATFDRVVGVQTMHHWTAPDAIVAELRRVLKPGGWCDLLDADADSKGIDGWIARTGGWPPDFWVRRMWRKYSLGQEGFDAMVARCRALDWDVEVGSLGFYRRIRCRL